MLRACVGERKREGEEREGGERPPQAFLKHCKARSSCEGNACFYTTVLSKWHWGLGARVLSWFYVFIMRETLIMCVELMFRGTQHCKQNGSLYSEYVYKKALQYTHALPWRQSRTRGTLDAGTSVKNMEHWAQGVRRQPQQSKFCAYDYGKVCTSVIGLPQPCNRYIYGQEEPLEYNLTRIISPIAVVSGDAPRIFGKPPIFILVYAPNFSQPEDWKTLRNIIATLGNTTKRHPCFCQYLLRQGCW